MNMSSDKQSIRSQKSGATPASQDPAPTARGTHAVRPLFEVQSKPLETGVVPVGKLRAPRRKSRLWAAAAAGLLSFNLMAADGTNAPTERQEAKTNAPATESANTRAARTNDDSRRENRDRSQQRSTPPATNAVVRAGQKQDFAAFRIVSERNIFDPNRSPRRANTNVAARPKPKVTESLALVGVMNYEKGVFAFFDGSRGEFRKALKPSDKIAGLKIVSVEANSVKLAKGDKTLELAVGSQLRREDEGEWKPGGAAESNRETSSSTSSGSTAATSSNASTSPSTSTTPSAGTAPSGGDNDVLRRLMQRREQE